MPVDGSRQKIVLLWKDVMLNFRKPAWLMCRTGFWKLNSLKSFLCPGENYSLLDVQRMLLVSKCQYCSLCRNVWRPGGRKGVGYDRREATERLNAMLFAAVQWWESWVDNSVARVLHVVCCSCIVSRRLNDRFWALFIETIQCLILCFTCRTGTHQKDVERS